MANKYTEAPLVLDGSVYNTDVPELLVHRIVTADFTIPNTSGSVTATGATIPHGAIITGVRMMAPSAVTITGASATAQLRIGTHPLCIASELSGFPGTSLVPRTTALHTSAGNHGHYVNIGGTSAAPAQLNLSVQSSSVNPVTARYFYYVDYLYALD